MAFTRSVHLAQGTTRAARRALAALLGAAGEGLFRSAGALMDAAYIVSPEQEPPLSAEAADRILLNVLTRIEADEAIRSFQDRVYRGVFSPNELREREFGPDSEPRA